MTKIAANGGMPMNGRTQSKLKTVLILVIIGAAVILLAEFARRRANSSSAKLPERRDYLRTQGSFHPDAVVGILWQTKTRTYDFHRRSRNEPWQPRVYPQRIQRRLNLLSHIHWQAIAAPSAPTATVTLTFSNGVTWTAVYANDVVAWISGQMKGRGAHLASIDSQLFSGEAFEPKEMTWCHSRVTAFHLLQPKPYSLLFSQGEWRQSVGSKTHALSPQQQAHLEDWLSRYCTVNVDSDLAPVPESDRLPWLDVSLKQGGRLQIFRTKNPPDGLVMVSTKNGKSTFETFISHELLNGLQKLGSPSAR